MPSPDGRITRRPAVRAALHSAVLASVAIGLAATGHAAPPQCPQATTQHLTLPQTAAAVAEHKPITVVALGSSSTAGSGASAPDKAYPARLEALLRASWPNTEVRVVNAGIGGQKADEMAARIEQDVLARHPVLVIWQAGANEALQHMDVTRFHDAIGSGLERLAASGADVVLMDNQLAPRIEQEPNNRAYDEALAHDAARHHNALFSRLRLMRQWQAQGVDAAADGMVGPDGLHHTDRGYACLANALGRAIVGAVAPQMASAGLASAGWGGAGSRQPH